MNQPTHFAASV